MTTALIFGSAGFVGQHLIDHLEDQGVTPVEFDVNYGDDPGDLRDYQRVRGVIEVAQPDWIVQLAAQPSPAESWVDPRATLDTGVQGTLNVLEACRALDWRGRLLLVGSEAEYGAELGRGPVDEASPCHPTSPYGVAKLAATTLGMAYARQHELDVLVARPSYHTGPGQHSRFAVSGFARQVAEVEIGRRAFVETGDLAGTRHLLDVRDVVRAYRLLLADAPGGVYNVSGGEAATMEEVLKTLCDMATAEIPTRLRQGGAPRTGEPPLMHPPSWEPLAALGWRPTWTLADTLGDLLGWWRERVR